MLTNSVNMEHMKNAIVDAVIKILLIPEWELQQVAARKCAFKNNKKVLEVSKKISWFASNIYVIS